MIINKAIFEENWKLIRNQSTKRWSLMADYDLNKVDKAEVKFDKFLMLLRVKYGYTSEQAREEIGKFWTEYIANHVNEKQSCIRHHQFINDKYPDKCLCDKQNPFDGEPFVFDKSPSRKETIDRT